MCPQLWKRIIKHPFNQGLLDGSLPYPVFLAFVKLDKQYLQTLSIAMQHTALRMQEGQAQA
ncbi:MAG: hypothetical protein B7X00_01090, partial [Legionella sp. 21-45-4]